MLVLVQRYIPILSLILLVPKLLLAQSPGNIADLEFFTDRPGMDYADRDFLGAPEECQSQCTRDQKCRSFTYVKPGVQGSLSRCYLKSGVPAAVPSNCCISGVSGLHIARSPAFIPDLDADRPGMDFSNFSLLSGFGPERCEFDCAHAQQCLSYTYVKPGSQEPNAHCWLKSGTPEVVPNSCCVSGVKRVQSLQILTVSLMT